MNPNKPSINVSLTDTNAIVCEQCSSEVLQKEFYYVQYLNF